MPCIMLECYRYHCKASTTISKSIYFKCRCSIEYEVVSKCSLDYSGDGAINAHTILEQWMKNEENRKRVQSVISGCN